MNELILLAVIAIVACVAMVAIVFGRPFFGSVKSSGMTMKIGGEKRNEGETDERKD